MDRNHPTRTPQSRGVRVGGPAAATCQRAGRQESIADAWHSSKPSRPVVARKLGDSAMVQIVHVLIGDGQSVAADAAVKTSALFLTATVVFRLTARRTVAQFAPFDWIVLAATAAHTDPGRLHRPAQPTTMRPHHRRSPGRAAPARTMQCRQRPPGGFRSKGRYIYRAGEHLGPHRPTPPEPQRRRSLPSLRHRYPRPVNPIRGPRRPRMQAKYQSKPPAL
jgi:hypothetical protein